MSRDIRNYVLHCNYPSFNQELTLNERGVVTLSASSCSVKQSELTTKIVKEVYEDKRIESIALKIETLVSLRDRIKRKKEGFLSFLFHDIKDLTKAIKILDEAIHANGGEASIKPSERVFRHRFITRIPLDLKIESPPTDEEDFNEWDFINWLSGQVFNSKEVQDFPEEEQWTRYYEIMKGFYQGDHFLIEEKEHHLRIDDLKAMNASIRTSKCYECGRKILSWNRKTGAPIYGSERIQDLNDVEENHYGFSGKHIKHVLFSSVELHETRSGGLVFGQTATQVQKIVRSENHQGKPLVKIGEKTRSVGNIDFESTRRFVALQMEPAPDSEGNDLLDWRFYANRVHRFVLSFFRKMLRFAFARIKSNVGPYGYGRTEYDPVVLHFDTRPRRRCASGSVA